jgi:hypothetical protein
MLLDILGAANRLLPTTRTRSDKEPFTAERKPDMDVLSRADLCFVVDTTGSMSPFLEAAKRHLMDAMTTLQAAANVDLHVGLVEYRDHPPQERSFVTRVSDLRGDFSAMQKVIEKLAAQGGGDSPEAVFDGVYDACVRIAWRPHSCRFALLVGDAPPHGAKAHEGSGSPCPCGYTVHTVTAAAEAHGVTVHALSMGRDQQTVTAFTAMARGTGGECVVANQGDAVIKAMTDVLTREFGSLTFDRDVLDAVLAAGELDTAAIAAHLGSARGPVAASLTRLGKRGFLETVMPPLPAAS